MAAIPLIEETSGGPAGGMVSGLVGLAPDSAENAHIELLAGERPERKLAIYPASAGFDLVLHDGERVTYRLSHQSDGRWSGERFSLPSATVLLTEPETRMDSPGEGGIGLLVEALAGASGYRSPTDDDARRRLETTLGLLLQAEPGIEAGFRSLKLRSPQFGPVVDTVLAARDAARPEPVVIDRDVYANGYVSGGKMHL